MGRDLPKSNATREQGEANAQATSSPQQVSQYGDYPSITEKVQKAVHTGTVRVLFTDVDATFVLGAGHHEEEIRQSLVDMRKLTAELNNNDFIIIPVTGSHLESKTRTTGSILERVTRGNLPGVGESTADRQYAVDAYVCDGGARAVQSIESDTASLDRAYAQIVVPQGFDYSSVGARAEAFASQVNSNALSDREFSLISKYDATAKQQRMHLQPGTEEGYHKNSNKFAFYFYANSLQERDEIENLFQREMRVLDLQVVCCEEKDATSAARRNPETRALLLNNQLPLKYCLDIVPFTKATAVNYFSDYISSLVTEEALKHGLTRPGIEVWACGDSGNDFPLMSASKVDRVIIVGGASEELIRRTARLEELGKNVFVESVSDRLGPASIFAAVFG